VVKPGVLTSAVTGVDKNIVTLTYGGAEGFFVNKVVFKEGATTLCEATAAPYTCVVVGGATGNRTFTASVYSGTATTPRYTLTTVAAVQFTYKLNIGWTLAGKYYRATVNMPANNTVTLSVLDATGKAVRIKAGVPVVKGANTVSVYWPRISTSAAYKSVLTAPGIYVTGTFSR
jgi:hypothetical protein